MKRFEKMLRGGMYRSRDGIILGVCKGIAEYFDFSVFWTRAVALILLFFTGLWPIVVLYFIAALIMKPEPVLPLRTDDQQEFYESYIHSRKSAADRLKRRYEKLERRIQRMENYVTSPEFDWEHKLNR
ncbi:MAG: phage shock protein C [Nitrospira bacterium SG8_3]|nr:MAG: phage shock protein C [Nitrospira bacterium SG8_3]